MSLSAISGLDAATVKSIGVELKLTCTATGDSTMAVLWKKAGSAVAAASFANEGTYTAVSNQLVNVLTIATLQSSDAGKTFEPHVA